MIYIFCPANRATGGPELLHQLGYKLNLLGYNAFMYYTNIQDGVHPVCPQYEKYHVPFTYDLCESPENIVIIPEIGISLLHILKGFRCAIWWLSVDNAIYNDEDLLYMQNNKKIIHLVQSQYALDFLQDTLNIHNNIYYLSDYLNSAFFTAEYNTDNSNRTDTVLFNPRKGLSKTLDLIANSDHKIKWQALKGLTPTGMREAMRAAKVYIDFGNHPGKDRIPREAAICGCHIITNKNGSAKNDIDVPIPQKYKFENDSEPEDILNQIYSLVKDYDNKKADYASYREMISNEFIEFEKDIIRFFTIYIKDNVHTFNTAEEYTEIILAEISNENFPMALRLLIDYRIRGFEENITIDIIETVIRIGIGEYQEAEICALRGLKKDNSSYELYLNLAHISLLTENIKRCKEYCAKALYYSQNTDDETYVREMCASFFN